MGVLDDLFLLFAFEFVGRGEEVFDGTEFLDEFGGGFFANAGDAGDVVDGVSHEGEDVDDLGGAFDAPFGADFGWAEDFDVGALAAGFVDFDVVGDELAEVFVWSDHEGLHLEGVGFFGEDADDVVGFEAVLGEDGDAHGVEEALDLGDGGGDVLGHFLALSFVVGEEVVARGGGGGVEDDGEVGGGLVGEDVEESVGEAVEGGGVDAVAGEDGIANEGEVGAVSERHAVEEEKPICHDGRMVAEGRGVVDGRLSIEGKVDGRRLLE